MQRVASFVLRIRASSATSVRPFHTAAEAYDEAAAVRRTLCALGSRLQVEDVTAGAVLGEWCHDGSRWLLEQTDARSPWVVPREVTSAG